jgi:hypothetical protein
MALRNFTKAIDVVFRDGIGSFLRCAINRPAAPDVARVQPSPQFLNERLGVLELVGDRCERCYTVMAVQGVQLLPGARSVGTS